MDDQKEVLYAVLDDLNEALNHMNELDDDEAHADIYWEIKDLTDTVLKRIQEL